MEKKEYTLAEMQELMRALRSVFDVVRLVDAYHAHTCRINEAGALEEEPFQCHAVWKKESRCSNCISLQVMAEQRRLTKYEFVGNQTFYVVSQFVLVDQNPYALEMVANVTNEFMLDAYGKDSLSRIIKKSNSRMYRDLLTGAYNRNYYEEQLKMIAGKSGVAMIDADNFKAVNDTYGHDAGDEVLQKIAKEILKDVRLSDVLVRYGGDEFFLVVTDIDEQTYRSRIEQVPARVAALRFPKYPGLRVSVSVGAAWIVQSSKTEDCMKKADKMLYQAKQNKNCLCYDH